MQDPLFFLILNIFFSLVVFVQILWKKSQYKNLLFDEQPVWYEMNTCNGLFRVTKNYQPTVVPLNSNQQFSVF